MPGTFTPNINLYKPLHNEVGWDTLVNTNFDILDSQIAGIESSLVTSVFGRVGDVVAETNDYASVPGGVQVGGDGGAFAAFDVLNSGFYLQDDGGSNTISGSDTSLNIYGAQRVQVFGSVGSGSGLVLDDIVNTFDLWNGLAAHIKADAASNITLNGISIVLQHTGGGINVNSTSFFFAQANMNAALGINHALLDVGGSAGIAGQVLSTTASAVQWISTSAIATSGAWSDLQNATANLTLSNAGFTTTFNQTSGVSWLWANTTIATNLTTNASPTHVLSANYWTGAASAADTWTMSSSLAAGTNGASTLTFLHAGSTATPVLQFGTINGFVGVMQFGNANIITHSGNVSTTFASSGAVSSSRLLLRGNGSSNATLANSSILLQEGSGSAITSGSHCVVAVTSTFAPASGSAAYVQFYINPTINVTGTASGGKYTALLVNVVETSLTGMSSTLLLDLQSGTTGGTSVFNVDHTGNLTQLNQTVATSGTTNASPTHVFSAQYWTGAASAADTWTIGSALTSGTNGVSRLNLTHAGSSGDAQVVFPTGSVANPGISFLGQNSSGIVGSGSAVWFSCAGAYTAGVKSTELIFGSAKLLTWSSNTNPAATGADTGISRLAAASLAIGNGTASDFTGSLKLTNLNVQGTLTNYNAEATAGVGTTYLRGVTSQKAETGADATLLSVTPAAVAGLYRIAVVLSVSAATSATLGWTATWTDSNAHAQAPTNLTLSTAGVSTLALTVTAAANATYYGEWYVDVNNAGTAIVVKTTFSGTSIAYKATATIERMA